MKIFRVWVYSNIHIALIAAALSLETNVLLNIRPLFVAPLFIFSATLLIYNLGYFKAIYSKEQSYREQARWMKARKTYWVFSMLLALSIIFFLVSDFNFKSQLILGFFGFLTTVYIMHDLKLFGKYFSIRSIPYLKVFIVAFTWSAVTILPQLMTSEFYFNDSNWKWLLFERFFFILSITLMFDVRDLQHDPKNLHTIPQSIGITRSKWLSFFFLAIALVGLFHLNLNHYQFIAILMIYFLTLIMIYHSHSDKDDIYYTGWFDGTIGLHAIAIIIFNFWP
jgi:hypothetical protein